MSIPHIPRNIGAFHGPERAPEPEAFTPRDGLAWLGISWETFEAAQAIRSGGPLNSALLDARAAQGTEITAAEVLAKHGIDPADPLAAVRAFDRERSRYDDTERED